MKKRILSPGKPIVTVFLSILVFGITMIAFSEETIEERLQKGLSSIRVRDIDRAGNVVFYFPIGAIFGKPGDEKSGRPLCVSTGDKLFIQGVFRFVADQEDLLELEKRAKAELGEQCRIQPVNPELFSFSIRIGRKEVPQEGAEDAKIIENDSQVLSRPVASGNIKGIPFQMLVSDSKNLATVSMDLQAVFYWTRSGLQSFSHQTSQASNQSVTVIETMNGSAVYNDISAASMTIQDQTIANDLASLTIDRHHEFPLK